MLSEAGKSWVYWIGEARISLVNISFNLFIFLFFSLFLSLSLRSSYSLNGPENFGQTLPKTRWLYFVEKLIEY